MLTESDKAAIIGLLTRYVEYWNRRANDQKAAAEVALRITTHNQKLANLAAAFAAFDMNVNDEKVWEILRGQVGESAYGRAITLGEEAAGRPLVIEAPKTKEPEKEAGKPAEDKPQVSSSAAQIPTVRDALLAQLEALGKKGAKAAELRAFLEITYAMKLHDKTVGMTLYRLSQDNRVHRVGRDWFFVPPSAETKNPGSSAPGSTEDRSEGKEEVT